LKDAVVTKLPVSIVPPLPVIAFILLSIEELNGIKSTPCIFVEEPDIEISPPMLFNSNFALDDDDTFICIPYPLLLVIPKAAPLVKAISPLPYVPLIVALFIV
jgi:hypothetical protein